MSDPNECTAPPQSEGRDALVELALNLHWSWNHGADQLWERLDSELWEATQNPWVILRTVSKDKIKSLWAEPEFRQRAETLLRQNRESFNSEAWFQKKHPDAALTAVALNLLGDGVRDALDPSARIRGGA